MKRPLGLQHGRDQLAYGMLKTSKFALQTILDYGGPIINQYNIINTRHALLIHSLEAATHANPSLSRQTMNTIPYVSSKHATSGCDEISTVLIKPGSVSCTAIVEGPSMDTNHIMRWMRTNNTFDRLNSTHAPAFTRISRAALPNGESEFSPVSETNISLYQRLLKQFFNNLDHVLSDLSSIAGSIVNENNEIIVMTTNSGQSELLQNFVCHAKSNGFDLSNVLVFATDEESWNVTKRMGLAVFYDEKVSFPYSSMLSFG